MNSSIYKTDKNGCPQVEEVGQGWRRQMGPSCHLLPPTPEPTGRHLDLKSLIIPPVKFLEFFFQPLLLLKVFSLVVLPKYRYGNGFILIISPLPNQNYIGSIMIHLELFCLGGTNINARVPLLHVLGMFVVISLLSGKVVSWLVCWQSFIYFIKQTPLEYLLCAKH